MKENHVYVFSLGYLIAAIISGRHPTFSGCLTAAILSDRHPNSTRMSLIRNSARPTFYLIRMSHSRNFVRPTFHLLRIFHIRRLPSDGRGGRLNFSEQTCPDPSVTPIRRTSVANGSDSPDSLARQILATRRIHLSSWGLNHQTSRLSLLSA